jgi:hypothetical protein
MRNRILFEPWSLGDAVIAAAVARQDPSLQLACDIRWHELLLAAPGPKPQLLPTSIGYTYRIKNDIIFGPRINNSMKAEILSIRGDVRDWKAAKSLFPNSSCRMNGWLSFLARRSALFDLPFKFGLMKIKNRYERWASLAGIPFKEVVTTYFEQQRQHRERQAVKSKKTITFHLGAQWQSKQYPHIAALIHNLEVAGLNVKLIAGPGDKLPERIKEHSVERAYGAKLFALLDNTNLAVTNDSGPLHYAAFIGAPVAAIARTSNLREWLPPLATAIESEKIPTGFKPDSRYCTDEILEAWPDAESAAKQILALIVE